MGVDKGSSCARSIDSRSVLIALVLDINAAVCFGKVGRQSDSQFNGLIDGQRYARLEYGGPGQVNSYRIAGSGNHFVLGTDLKGQLASISTFDVHFQIGLNHNGDGLTAIYRNALCSECNLSGFLGADHGRIVGHAGGSHRVGQGLGGISSLGSGLHSGLSNNARNVSGDRHSGLTGSYSGFNIGNLVTNLVSESTLIAGHKALIRSQISAGVGGEITARDGNAFIAVVLFLNYLNGINIRLEIAACNRNLRVIAHTRVTCFAIKNKCGARNHNTGIADLTGHVTGGIEHTAINGHLSTTCNNAGTASNIECTAVNRDIIFPRRIDTASYITTRLNCAVEGATIDCNLIGPTFSLCTIENYNCIIDTGKYTILDSNSCTNNGFVSSNGAFLTGNLCVFDGCCRVSANTDTGILTRVDFTGFFRICDGQCTIVNDSIVFTICWSCNLMSIQIKRNAFSSRNYHLSVHIISQLDGRAVSSILDRIGKVGKRTAGDGEFVIGAIHITIEKAARNSDRDIF